MERLYLGITVTSTYALVTMALYPSVYLAIRPPLRSCDGRIARCGVGQIVSGDLIKIGVAASLAKQSGTQRSNDHDT